MGDQLRMHNEIRAWLTGLRDTEPERARMVGEAVLALLDAGESLGPPLVVPPESALRPLNDPREALDYSYQRQLEALTKIRRGVADVATSRKRIELQVSQLEQLAARLASQRAQALNAGEQELATEARAREAEVQDQLSGLRRQFVILTGEEEKLTAASQRLAAKVNAFRTQKETIKATYTAAEASQRVREAFADIGADASDLEVPNGEAADSPGPGGAAAAGDEPARETRDATPASAGGAGPEDQDSILPPPGLMELRPGAPGNVRAALLFVAEPHDTAVLLARVEDPGGSPGGYQEVIPIAAARLAVAQSGPAAAGPPADPAAADGFTSYDAESFLDEFFPGEETEVEIGAAALAARHRAHTLAEARQRMRLTQAQVARRMNVRQERVSAIERAEPGATEVRTLAAYVRALSGRLEITMHIGGERIVLR
jgi:DNA-binding XRE family transcriptional regulator